MNKPKFITFTGADDHTSKRGMAELALEYPIEWGLLFSPQRQGSGRYPSMACITDLLANYRLDFAAHLCGGHSRDLIATGRTEVDPLLKGRVNRVQVNTSQTFNAMDLQRWGQGIRADVIVQCRGPFPRDLAVRWLFDASGGRGIEPAAWPPAKSVMHEMRGYAGGLNPANVAAHVETIGRLAANYWIDMETGVRDENDRFDLAKCRAVCEAVYGRA